MLPEGVPVLESYRTGLHGTKVTGSMLSRYLLPGRYVFIWYRNKTLVYRTSISHPVGSDVTVPVHLLTSSTTQTPSTTTIGWRDDYGCMMNEDGFFPDGAQVSSSIETTICSSPPPQTNHSPAIM